VKLAWKKSRVEHVRSFSSEQMEITNGLAILTNLETSEGHIANF
jgi:hypothetical protein